MPFPASPAPAYFTLLTPADSERNVICYRGHANTIDWNVGGTAGSSPVGSGTTNRLSFNLNKSGATGYTVLDYEGTVVSSGAVSGTTVTPAPPVGGWQPGWYRIRLTGPSTDALFGTSYGATNFCVMRQTPGFKTNPASATIYSLEDFTTKGVLGFGISRHSLQNVALTDAANPTADQGNGTSLAAVRNNITQFNATKSSDSVRTQPVMVTFPNGGVDKIVVPDATTGIFVNVYCKDETIDGSQVFVATGPGTNASTSKIRVFTPNSSTLVETFDNITDGGDAATKTLTSNYIRAFDEGRPLAATLAATAIGNGVKTGVTNAVNDLYPRGVTRYEGPSNEPRIDGKEIITACRIFQATVHAANAAAIVMGPCPVDIRGIPSWTTFFDNGGGTYEDEIAFHAYNSQTLGDLSLGRYEIEGFLALLASKGQSGKLLWHTEATHVFCSVAGVYHPRRSRVPLLQVLLFEQYGLPRERNIVWYDRSGGFWAYPAWFENGDGSLNPYALLLRVLAEETYEKTHHHAIDFGSFQGNSIFLGSVYMHPTNDTSTAVVMAQSWIPGSSVTFTVTGTALPLVTVDGWGNETLVAQSSGRITVTVKDIPTYVRLPAGVRLSVYSVNDWGPSPPPSISRAGTATMAGSAATVLNDNGFLIDYPTNTGVTPLTVVPGVFQILFASTVNVDRVIIHSTQPWQNNSVLTDFDVQTTVDGGTNWTTRATPTIAAATSINFGTDSNNAGCTRETFWPEQSIFDVPLGGTFACNGVRINVRSTSYGGEPDAASVAGGLGQGASGQWMTITELIIPSASSPTVTSPPSVPANTTAPALTGTAKVGQQIQCSQGAWSNAPSAWSFQWREASTVGGTYTDIAGQIRSDFIVPPAQVGKFLKVFVVAANVAGAGTGVLTAATTQVTA